MRSISMNVNQTPVKMRLHALILKIDMSASVSQDLKESTVNLRLMNVSQILAKTLGHALIFWLPTVADVLMDLRYLY